MRTVTRHVVGIVGLVALVATGAACGGGGPTLSAGLIARAAAATNSEDSARFVMTMEADGQTIEAEGAMTFDAQQFLLEISIPGGGSIEERVVDGILYIRLPDSSATPTPWLMVDMGDLLPEQQAEARSSVGFDPSSSLESLRAAFGEVEDLGVDELRAGRATHYRVHLDADRVFDDDRVRSRLNDSQLEVLRSMDGSPMDVWISDDGRVLKQRFKMDLPGSDIGAMTMTIEFYDFGAGVDVEAPPASDVTDWTAKFHELAGI